MLRALDFTSLGSFFCPYYAFILSAEHSGLANSELLFSTMTVYMLGAGSYVSTVNALLTPDVHLMAMCFQIWLPLVPRSPTQENEQTLRQTLDMKGII
jgi:hypothetical protein